MSYGFNIHSIFNLPDELTEGIELNMVKEKDKLKRVMLETEMERYLLARYPNKVCTGGDGVIDSVAVHDIAIDDLGYERYELIGAGKLNQTSLFIMGEDRDVIEF